MRWLRSVSWRWAVWFACASCGWQVKLAKAIDGQLGGALVPAITVDDLKACATPAQHRDPEKFWTGKKVFQKLGIVVEDRDFIVRDRYWEIDANAVGTVVRVRQDSIGPVCRVVFVSTEHWQQRGFEKKPVAMTTEKQALQVTHAGYEAVSISTSYRIEGVAVDRRFCGLIVSEDGDGRSVEFPAALLSKAMPRLNDKVVRGPDWCDGYADGGAVPIGQIERVAEGCEGVVVKERDRDGNIDVEWLRTGRTTTHRFDSRDFYDIELCEKKEDGGAK
jgi:hypothetical protein